MRFRKFCLPALILFAASALCCSAQTKALANTDIAVEGFYQTTPTVSGNGISVRATHSAGGAAFFRHSYRWWLGYEAGYADTRYTNEYSGQSFGVQSNMHEFAGSYFIHGPRALGIEPFATAGVSGVLFSPSLNGGQNAAWQMRPGINFGAGVNVPLVSSHFGARVEYRGVYYKAPDFGQARYSTGAFRETSEPMAGLYLRF
jgi:opacity protein-like surface antigen